MKLKDYLKDKKYFLLFYLTLMSFVSAVIYLDGTIKVSAGNILYINFVSLVFLVIYLIGGFIFYRKYYIIINDIINNHKEDTINRLPEPKTYEQSLYNQLLKDVYSQQNERFDRLYEDKKENQEFITSWVHEVKTPIAVSRLIIENSMGKPQNETLNSIEEELDKIDNYIEQALYYSKIDDFSKDYFIKEIDIDRIVKDVVKKHARTFINKGMVISMDDIHISIATDKKWLIFIIDQILSNSLKYTGKGGKISIKVQKEDNEKRLIIEDNGIGIRSEDIGRVFDRGFTGYNGRENSKSTGMGLYLAKRLASKLGHDITIESAYGEYTRVTIHFPKLTDYYNVIKV